MFFVFYVGGGGAWRLSGNWDGTLVNALAFRYGNEFTGSKGTERHGVVHRLDKGTSGVRITTYLPTRTFVSDKDGRFLF